MGTTGSENEWLNTKVDPATCPAGAGMSGMGPLQKTMVSLGTTRSNPPPGTEISMHVPLVYRGVCIYVVVDQFSPVRTIWAPTAHTK